MPIRVSSTEFVSQLSREYGPPLLRFLERLLGRRDVAEDVAQEAYLKLYRLTRPEEVSCPRALLFDVATKLAIDRLRRQRGDVTRADDMTDIESVPDDSSRPDRRALIDEAMRRLTHIIDELQPNLRQVIVMRYVTGMPRQAIAEELHVSIGAVEQRLTRALAQCRERLSAHGIDWAGFE